MFGRNKNTKLAQKLVNIAEIWTVPTARQKSKVRCRDNDTAEVGAAGRDGALAQRHGAVWRCSGAQLPSWRRRERRDVGLGRMRKSRSHATLSGCCLERREVEKGGSLAEF